MAPSVPRDMRGVVSPGPVRRSVGACLDGRTVVTEKALGADIFENAASECEGPLRVAAAVTSARGQPPVVIGHRGVAVKKAHNARVRR